MVLDLLQDRKRGQRHLPWIISAMRCMRSMLRGCKGRYQLSTTMASIEQMVRSVIPNFNANVSMDQDLSVSEPQQGQQPSAISVESIKASASGVTEAPALVYPSMPFGFDVNGRYPGEIAAIPTLEGQNDFTAADVGWDIDFSTMDMEAFLSIDPSQAWGFRT